MSDQYETVKKRIAARAEKYGFKEANLYELISLAETLQGSNAEFVVPTIHGIEDSDIFAFVSSYVGENGETFNHLYSKFCKYQTLEETKQGILNADSAKELQKIRELIKQAFIENIFSVDTTNLAKKIMARSTGKEDTEELANPGGNKSYANVDNTPESCSQAIGKVVASYSSEKSILQRLLGNDDITSPPFMPVLLQDMIGVSSEDSDVVCSGVMYTGKHACHIQIALGHGELIVNSKAPFDSFFSGSDRVIYSDIQAKTHRLAPSENGLKMVPNSKELKYNPSIPDTVVRRLMLIGEAIEQHYGKPRDVEFVYDPQKNIIYIVQARPIPDDKLSLDLPSSIPPQKLELVKAQAKKIHRGIVVTPAKNAARVITAPEQVIIKDNMKQVLDYYLHTLTAEEKQNIKAVIVSKEAPRTSHEAAQFKSLSIPAIAIANLEPIEQAIQDKSVALIVDPQRSQVIDWSNNFSSNSDLFNEDVGILQHGLFKSSLAARQTIKTRNFNFDTEETLNLSAGLETLDDAELIGNMLDSIENKQNQHAYAKLLKYIYAIIEQESTVEISQTLSASELLELIEAADFSSDNAKPVAALQKILLQAISLQRAYPEKMQGLFQQAMLSGLEIYRRVMEIGGYTDKEQVGPIKAELLDLTSKLHGLIYYSGKRGVQSFSIAQMFAREQAEEKAKALLQNRNLTSLIHDKDKFAVCVDLFQLSNIATNGFVRDQWNEFILSIINDDQLTAKLGNRLIAVVNAGLAGEWLNKLFIKESNGDYLATLTNLAKETDLFLHEMQQLKLDELEQIIAEWEDKTADWAIPDRFTKLWKNCSKSLLPLIDKLSIDGNVHPFTQTRINNLSLRLTNTLDESIKSMKGSEKYKEQNKQLEQAKNFVPSLQPLHQLMEKWIRYHQESETNNSSTVSQEQMLNIIKSAFISRCNIIQDDSSTLQQVIEQTQSSPNFSVVKAVYKPNCRLWEKNYFLDNFMKIQDSITLEDLYTLFHQNIIDSINQLTPKIAVDYDKIVPKELQKFRNTFKNTTHKGSDYAGCGVVRCNEPVFAGNIVKYTFYCALGKHSYDMSLSLNNNTNKIQLDYTLTDGGGGDEHGRYTDIEFILNLSCSQLNNICDNTEILVAPRRDYKSIKFSLLFEQSTFNSNVIEHLSNLIKGIAERTYAEEKRSIQEFIPSYVNLSSSELIESINRNCSPNLFGEIAKRIGTQVNDLDTTGTPLVFSLGPIPFGTWKIEKLLECPDFNLHQVDQNGNSLTHRILNDDQMSGLSSDLLIQSIARKDHSITNAILNSSKFCEKKKLNNLFKSYLSTSTIEDDILLKVIANNEVMIQLLTLAVGENYADFINENQTKKKGYFDKKHSVCVFADTVGNLLIRTVVCMKNETDNQYLADLNIVLNSAICTEQMLKQTAYHYKQMTALMIAAYYNNEVVLDKFLSSGKLTEKVLQANIDMVDALTTAPPETITLIKQRLSNLQSRFSASPNTNSNPLRFSQSLRESESMTQKEDEGSKNTPKNTKL